jgi:hypothetical protein
VAFFGVLYYSGLRPEEAIALRRQDVKLPELLWDEESHGWVEARRAWGELHLRAAKPDVGRQWTDDGSSRDSRGLSSVPKVRPGGFPVRPPPSTYSVSTSPAPMVNQVS